MLLNVIIVISRIKNLYVSEKWRAPKNYVTSPWQIVYMKTAGISGVLAIDALK